MRRSPYQLAVTSATSMVLVFTLSSPSFAVAFHARTTGGKGAAKRYLADSVPVDAASARFESAALSWLGDPKITNAKAVSKAQPMISALVTFELKLQAQHWPSSAKADVKALVSSVADLVVDLRSLSRADLQKTTSWESPLLRDQTRTDVVTNRLRHDLGLHSLS